MTKKMMETERIGSEVDRTIKAISNRLSSELESFIGSKITPATFDGIKAQIEKSIILGSDSEVDVRAGSEPGSVEIDVKAKSDIKAIFELDKTRSAFSGVYVPPCEDRDGNTVEARDLVKFNPRSENTAKKCKRLVVGQTYKVDEISGRSIKITTGPLKFNWYKATNFEVQERPLSGFMQELQNL